MTDFTPLDLASAPATTTEPAVALATPAAAVAAAAQLAARLLAQAAATDTVGGFPTLEMQWLREAGLLAAPLPLGQGGAGLGESANTLPLLQTLYHLGRGNLAVARLWEGHLNALLLVRRFGTPAQQAKAATDARAGHLFGVGNTENPVEGVRLEPLPEVGRYQLRGAKTFASGAGHVSRALLTAALPDKKGWQMLLLPTDQQKPTLDASFWRPLGMRATASYRAQLDYLKLGYQDLIGSADAYYQQPWFGGGAVRFAAAQLGGAAAVLDETRRFLRRQHRTDDPFQRQRLGELLVLHEAGQRWLHGAAEHAALPALASAAPVDPARLAAIGAYANLMRTAVEEICLTTLRLAERSVGARGLLQPEPFERLHRDLTHYLRQPAPDAALADAGRFALASDKPAYQLF